MKKYVRIHWILAFVIVFAFTGTSMAGEKATREECVAKVGEAAKMIQKIGRDAAFKKLTEKNSPFIWKNSHVFCIDAEEGILLAHKTPRYVGYQIRDSYKDAKGGNPYADILNLAKTKDKGWKTFMRVRTGKDPLLKHMYFQKIANENIVLCAGYYPSVDSCSQEKATREECIAKVDAALKEICEIGLDGALKKISEPKGPYVWKDSYVFCMNDGEGNLLAHPFSRFKGFPMKNYRDADGKQPFVEIIELVNSKGKVWKSYMFEVAGEAPKLKNSYFVKVPGEKAIIGAGYFE